MKASDFYTSLLLAILQLDIMKLNRTLCVFILPTEANKLISDICTKNEVDCPPPRTTARLLDKVNMTNQTVMILTYHIRHEQTADPMCHKNVNIS